MRRAAARAASRRGSCITIFRPPSHGASSSASGTRVVLPAPGGATSTAAVRSASAAFRRGRASSTGRVVLIVTTSYEQVDLTVEIVEPKRRSHVDESRVTV